MFPTTSETYPSASFRYSCSEAPELSNYHQDRVANMEKLDGVLYFYSLDVRVRVKGLSPSDKSTLMKKRP